MNRMVVVVIIVIAATLMASMSGIVDASPPRSTPAVTFGVNQQRSGLVPYNGTTSTGQVFEFQIKAMTSPVYTTSDWFLLVAASGTTAAPVLQCAAYYGKYNFVNFPSFLTNVTFVGIPSLSNDYRAYIVVSAPAWSGMVVFSHTCNPLYALDLQSPSLSMSPIVLADNSVVVSAGNQLRMIANSSDPIGGVTLWSTTIDDGPVSSVGLALSADNSTGVLFVSYSTSYRGQYSVCVQALAPLGDGKVGFSPLWTQRIGASEGSYCGNQPFCSLTPVLCGSQVLIVTSDSVSAFDQASGRSLWSYSGSFSGDYHQPACHPSGMVVVVDSNSNVLAFLPKDNNPTPSELWRRSTGAFQVVRAPVIDAVGNIYVIGGASRPTDPDNPKLLMFDYTGTLLITRGLRVPTSTLSDPRFISQPVVLTNRILVGVGSLIQLS